MVLVHRCTVLKTFNKRKRYAEMPKLNDAKIRWIIREMETGERTEQEIGQVQGVTRQRVSQLWNEYQRTGEMPVLQQPGRPVEPLSERE